MNELHINKSAILFIFVIATVLFLYHSTALHIWQHWLNSEAYSHGFLLLILSVMMIYSRWKQNEITINANLNILGLIIVVLLSFGWVLARIGNVQVVQQLSLVVSCALVPLTLFGYRMGRRFILPIAILLLAIPIWDILLPYLQTITAITVNVFLNLFAFTAVRDGSLIFVPSGTFEVAESCSGLRQFIVAIIIAILFIYRYKLNIGVSFIFILATMMLAVIVNILRVFIVVVIGEHTNMQHPLVHEHAVLGWSLFGVTIFIWIYYSSKYVFSHRALVRPSKIINRKDNNRQQISLNQKVICKVSLIILAFSTGPLLYMYFSTNYITSHYMEINLPDNIHNFKRQPFKGKNWQPFINGADDVYSKTYKNEEEASVDVFIYRYRHQEQGKEAIHVGNRLYDPQKWKIMERENKVLSVSPSRELQVEIIKIQTLSGNERLIYRWYHTFNKDVASPLFAKGLNIIGSMLGDPSISIVIVSAEIGREPEILERQLFTFAQAIQSSLDVANL